MFQRDYLMRQIQQLVQVLERVLLFKRQDQLHEASQFVEESLIEMFEMGIDDLIRLDSEELLNLCTEGDRFLTDKALVLAEVLEEEGHTLLMLHDERALSVSEKALLLFESVLDAGDTIVPHDIYPRIDSLRQIIENP